MVGHVFRAGAGRITLLEQHAGIMEIGGEEASHEHVGGNGDMVAVQPIKESNRRQHHHLAVAEIVVRQGVFLKIGM